MSNFSTFQWQTQLGSTNHCVHELRSTVRSAEWQFGFLWNTIYSKSACQISSLLWNPNIHNCPKLVNVLSKMNTVQTVQPTSKNNFDIFHVFTSKSFKWSCPFTLSDLICLCTSHPLHECSMPCSSHYLWLDHLITQYMNI